jgi:wyosine [tRNA(Phe)-imidazoG37] synthetase (radical SAM superfamily)
MLTALMERVVQGPLENERHGRHLLIEPTCETNRPDVYPTQAVVVTTAARRIIELSKAGEKIADVVVSGATDPMLHEDFREIAENLKELCKKWYPKVGMTLETNGFALGTADLRHCLTLFARPIVRFSYGTQKTFAALTGRKPADLKDVAENIGRVELERWVMEVCLVRGGVDNSTESELRGIAKYASEFRPGSIQLTTLAKPDPELKTKAVTKTAIEKAQAKLADKTGVEVRIVDPI